MKIDRDRIKQIYDRTFVQANFRDGTIRDHHLLFAEAIIKELEKEHRRQIQLLRDALEAVTDCLERVGDSRKDGHIVRWGKDALAQTQPQESTDEN